MRFPVVIVLGVLSSCLFGQDLLKPLYVTASRSSQLGLDLPYTATYLDASDIEGNDIRTLPKALQYTPGVLVQQTAYGHGSPFIRGFTGRQNLLLVDGIRINNSTYRGGPVQYWNTVDSLAVDHLELIKSQGSVLYGSDAIGGTLNAFTKSSDFRSRAAGEIYQGGRVAYEYRMNGEGSHIGRFETETGIGDQFGAHLGLSLKDYGDISSDAIGRMSGTGYPEQDMDFRMDWAVGNDSTLTFATQYVNQDKINRWHRTINNPGWTDGNHKADAGIYAANVYDQERMLSYLRYSGSNPVADAFIQRWSATVSYQTTADSEFQERNNPLNNRNIRQRHIDLDTYGIDLTLETDTDQGTWVYGFDYYRDEVDSRGYDNNNAGTAYAVALPLADNSSYDLLGAFGQYIWRPTEAWEITGGTRLTHARATLRGGIDESPEWSSMVGSLRALYHLDEIWSVFGGVSQAFRAPNLDDLTGQATTKGGIDTLGSLNADPESYLTYEIGTRRVAGDLSLEMSLFYTDITDQIVSVDQSAISTVQKITNAGDGYIFGLEMEGLWQIAPQWTLRGFAGWQDGRSEIPDYLGGPMITDNPARLLPLTASMALRWTSESDKFWVQGRLFGARQEDRLSDADQKDDSQRIPTNGTPGYVVASVNAGWKVNEQLNLTCGIENVLDEDYRIHGSGQNEPGIMGIFGAELTW